VPLFALRALSLAGFSRIEGCQITAKEFPSDAVRMSSRPDPLRVNGSMIQTREGKVGRMGAKKEDMAMGQAQPRKGLTILRTIFL
jgi:hypothetical protein